jgi:hypothetical protein
VISAAPKRTLRYREAVAYKGFQAGRHRPSCSLPANEIWTRRRWIAMQRLMQFQGMNSEDARAFAEKWLSAWSGNRPELLASFYSPDAIYSDPAVPQGV